MIIERVTNIYLMVDQEHPPASNSTALSIIVSRRHRQRACWTARLLTYCCIKQILYDKDIFLL